MKIEQDKKALMQFLNNTYTQQEAKEALDFINDEENELLVNHWMSKAWEEDAWEQSAEVVNKEKLYEEARAIMKPKTINLSINIQWLKLISIAVIVFVLAIPLFLRNFKSSSVMTPQTCITTQAGEVKNIVLPDGTAVTINSLSKMTFPDEFLSSERRVTLEGEAYFDVIRNEKQPFIVCTPNFDINVLGTEFNIKAYETDETQAVNVSDGVVEMKIKDASFKLVKDDYVGFNTNTHAIYKEKGYHLTSNWKTGGLSFNKTPIRDVARDLERLYDCTIIFDGTMEFNNIISGQHPNPSLTSVLESIEITTKIKYKYTEPNKILLYK